MFRRPPWRELIMTKEPFTPRATMRGAMVQPPPFFAEFVDRGGEVGGEVPPERRFTDVGPVGGVVWTQADAEVDWVAD